MHSFRDNENRSWRVEINVTAIKAVRVLASVDLLALVQDKCKGLAELIGDPIKLVDVVYALCKDQCDKAGVSDEQFGRAMAGEALERAADAFLRAYELFGHGPQRAALKKLRESLGILTTEALTELETVDPQKIATAVKVMLKAEADKNTTSPAPPILTI